MSLMYAGIAMGVGSIVGGAISAHGAQSAAQTQANTTQQGLAQQQQMFDTQRADLAPWRAAGGTALGTIMDNTVGQSGNNNYFTHQFDINDLYNGLSPNYQFMLQQGQGATTNMANAMGGLGGNSLKAINDYTQNYAQNAYQQAYQNYQGQRNDIFTRLSTIAGQGLQGSGAGATGSPQFSSSIGNMYSNLAGAQASGIVGSANAISGGINNAAAGMYLSQIGNQGNNGGMGYPIGNVPGVNVATGMPTG